MDERQYNMDERQIGYFSPPIPLSNKPTTSPQPMHEPYQPNHIAKY